MATRKPVDPSSWSMLEQLAEGMRSAKVKADESFLLGAWAGRHYAALFDHLTERYQAQANHERHIHLPGDKLVLLKMICDDLNRQLTEQREQAEREDREIAAYEAKLVAEAAQLAEQLQAEEAARAGA